MSRRMQLEERQVQFVEAAAKVIADEGMERATTRRIAEAAGAPLASLHYCFRGKDELFDVVQQYLTQDFSSRLSLLPPEAVGLEAVMTAHAHRVWEYVTAHPEQQVAIFELIFRQYRHAKSADDGQPMDHVEMHQAWNDATSELYAHAAQAAGEPIPVNLEAITQMFIAGIDGLTLLFISSPKLARVDEVLSLLIDSVIRACEYETGDLSV